MTDAGTSVGPRLRAERERRGLSSQKAADELHLDGWVIEALEAGDYERIGPSVYAKGHLKRYAALLDLPVAEIMDGYDSRTQAPRAPAPPPPANVRLRPDPPAVANLPWPLIAGSVAVALLAIGVLWWKPWHRHGSVPIAAEPLAANPSAASADPAAGSPPPPRKPRRRRRHRRRPNSCRQRPDRPERPRRRPRGPRRRRPPTRWLGW